jgi:type 1 glutamine amidotransferase
MIPKSLRRYFIAVAVFLFAALVAFAADSRPKLVMLIAEPEYDTGKSLPEFAAKNLEKDFRVVVVAGVPGQTETAFSGIEEVSTADVLLVSVRRRTPPKAQLDVIRQHVAAGKPVVGIRTASHAFALGRGQALAPGNADWPLFDAEVIGGNYSNHHGKGPVTAVTAGSDNIGPHPILRGVTLPFSTETTLYKNTPLRPGATALLTGTIPGQPAEPLAWTFERPQGGRTFYTSLGGPNDFKNPSFVALLRNGIQWAARK